MQQTTALQLRQFVPKIAPMLQCSTSAKQQFSRKSDFPQQLNGD
jgi:hypothetical protein